MTIAQQVENILRAVPATRSSDKELQVIYMQKFGMNLSPEQIEVFKDMPSLETLRRIRQKIQEEGKYPATKEIRKERTFKSLQMQQTMPTIKVDNIEKTLSGKVVLPWGQ